MTAIISSQRLQTLSILACASLFFWVLSAGAGRPAVAVALCLTLFMAGILLTKRNFRPLPGWYICGALALLQYFIFFGSVAAFNPPLETAEFTQRADFLMFWVIGGVLSLILLWVWANIRPPASFMAIAVGVSAACVISIMVLSRIFPETETVCRVTGPSNNYFFPAFVLGVLSVLSLSPRLKIPLWGQILLIIGSLLVMGFVSGTRMILLAYVICLGSAFLVLGASRAVTLKQIAIWTGVACFGMFLSIGLDLIESCSFSARLQMLLTDAVTGIEGAKATEGISNSVNIRLQLFQKGWEVAKIRLLIGHGIAAENSVSEAVHPALSMVHNQYLSWTIWGGIPGLISGVVFLAAPLVLFFSNYPKWHVAILCGSISGMLALSNVSDTLLRTDYFLIFYLVVTSVVLGLALPRQKGP